MTIKPKTAVAGTSAGLLAALALIIPVIQKWEGHESRPYKDVVGVVTVCYGHTGPDIQLKRWYSPAECTKMLEKDLEKFSTGVLTISPELADQPYILAATISFSYNVGLETYRKSSVARNFKARNWQAGCDAMLKYTYAKGRYIQGLANRRKDEYKICIKGISDEH